MKIGLEKLESHKEVAVKVLLDSRAIDLFMDTKFPKVKRFKLERLKNPLLVQNVNGTVNVEGAITHQVKCNMFFKGHVKRAQINVCNLEKTEVILDIPWLAAHNPEINQKKREVQIMQYSSICGKRKQKIQKQKQVRKIEEGKIVEKLVPRRFQKQKKVFGKEKSKRMPTRKLWNYVIELKKEFVLRKEKKYKHLWRINCKKDIFSYQSYHRLCQYTLQQKKIARGGWYRITII